MKNLCAVIFRKMIRLVNVDHLCVTLLVLLMGWLLPFASINLTVFNPVKKALADFSMTDIFYEIQNSSGVKEFNDDIVLVDMTELYDRRKIAQCIRNITRCQPKVFVIDLAHPIKSVARLTKYQRYAVEKERNVPYTTQLTSECLQFGIK